MSVGRRVQARLTELKMSHTELARRVGLARSTIDWLVSGRSRSSLHLHRIAEALETTASYLEGETEDPAADASAPVPGPLVQLLELPVALPAEPLLAAAFKTVIASTGRESEDDLARVLARSLPSLLRLPDDAFWHSSAFAVREIAAR